MKKLKNVFPAGQRVRTKNPVLGDGVIKTIYHIPGGGAGYKVKLDEKAPHEYAFVTDEVLLFHENLIALDLSI